MYDDPVTSWIYNNLFWKIDPTLWASDSKIRAFVFAVYIFCIKLESS